MEYRKRLDNLKKKINKEQLPPNIKNVLYAYKKHIKKLYNIIFVLINLNIFFIFFYKNQK